MNYLYLIVLCAFVPYSFSMEKKLSKKIRKNRQHSVSFLLNPLKTTERNSIEAIHNYNKFCSSQKTLNELFIRLDKTTKELDKATKDKELILAQIELVSQSIKHQTGSEIKCNYCLKDCSNVRSLKQHYNWHTRTGYVCDICQIAYGNLVNYKNHVKNKHTIEL